MTLLRRAATALLLCVLTMTVQTAWAYSAFSGGDGSQDNPYKIANTADLDQLASDVNGGNNYDGKNFVMTADITYDPNALTIDTDGDGIIDSNFTPIGFNGKSFAGKFYGNGYTISNIVVTGDPSVSGRGLFGKTDGATLDGITVSGIVTGTASYVGGLVGNAVGTTITNCLANCTVSSTSYYTGGLAGGISERTTINGCSTDGTVTSTSSYTGGLVGYCGEGTCTISDSFSAADVTGNEFTGGFLGYVAEGNLTISGCRADGFTGGSGKVGGFVGSIDNNGENSDHIGGTVKLSGCVARGDVRSFASSYGGFIGEVANKNATLSSCWCSGAVWGTGGDIGSFVGNCKVGTLQDVVQNVLQDCGVYPYAAGPRHFCVNTIEIQGGTLSATDYATMTNGWPAVKKHIRNATPIATAEDLLAIGTDATTLAGCYVLVDDIDFGNQTIEPIGNFVTPFTGEFYGQGHKISGFTVNSTEPNVGFFGYIKGGRVNNLRLDGEVIGNPSAPSTPITPSTSGNQSYTFCVGGFAGQIDSKSLVDDCSFVGQVETNSSGKVGGFVGFTEDSPMILRSCVDDAYINNESSEKFTGGFIGLHINGFIKDCYAVADVASSGSYVGGFAGHVAPTPQIATSWCSGEIGASGNYVGAFVGQINAQDRITNSYYDNNPNSGMKAAGTQSAGGSDNYTGITGLYDMSDPDNFPSFDFVATWEIDEYSRYPVFRRGQQHVTFDPAGGTCGVESKDYAIGGYGGYYEDLPVPVRPGYNFLGWFDDYGIQVTDESTVTFDTNRTLHARWSTIPWTGTGTEDDPYIIEYPSQLDLLATNVNNGESYIDTYFQLGADIAYDPNVLTIDNDGDGNGDSNYTPIGYCDLEEMFIDPEQGSQIITVMFPFAGHFDGANHVVSGIRLYKDGTELATDCNQALFGVIGIDPEFGTAEVKNVILADAHITGYDYASGIVGMSYFGAVSNCHVLGDVTIDAVQSDADNHGGIMGSNSAGSVTSCTSAATITINPGCIVGENGGTFSDCLYLGTATALSDNENNSDILTLLSQRTAALTAVERTPALSTAIDVTLSGRTLYKDGDWNTLCLPFDLALEGSPLAGATVKKLTASTSKLEESKLYLYFEDETTTMTAGTPYIIKWTRANDYEDDADHNIVSPAFTGVTIDATDRSVTSTDGSVCFKGTYSPIIWDNKNQTVLFLGAENTLYFPQPKDGQNPRINAFRAYFHVSGAASVRQFVLNFDGDCEAQGITTTDYTDLTDKAGAWFDLNGRRLSGKPTARGIYIHNGRKVVVP